MIVSCKDNLWLLKLTTFHNIFIIKSYFKKSVGYTLIFWSKRPMGLSLTAKKTVLPNLWLFFFFFLHNMVPHVTIWKRFYFKFVKKIFFLTDLLLFSIFKELSVNVRSNWTSEFHGSLCYTDEIKCFITWHWTFVTTWGCPLKSTIQDTI